MDDIAMPQAIGENGNFPVGEVAEIAPAFIKITDFIAVSANKHLMDQALLTIRVLDLNAASPTISGGDCWPDAFADFFAEYHAEQKRPRAKAGDRQREVKTPCRFDRQITNATKPRNETAEVVATKRQTTTIL